MRRHDRTGVVAMILFAAWLLPAAADGQEPDELVEPDRGDRVTLSDIAAYRAALSGRTTADDAGPSDPPARVGFRDLWKHPQVHQGRRVTIDGRVERTFRQGAIGSFPPLVEAWVFSPSGDPFCVVYPREDAGGSTESASGSRDAGAVVTVSPSAPAGNVRKKAGAPAERSASAAQSGPGHTVQFTGTFLKMIRYTTADGERVAPLIIGDRPPAPAAGAKGSRRTGEISSAREILRALGGGGDDGAAEPGRAWSDSSWLLGLLLIAIAALAIAGRHLRDARSLGPRVAARRRRLEADTRAGEGAEPDLPLQFLDSPDKTASER